MQARETETDFQGVTLAALFRDKVAVTPLPKTERGSGTGPVWALPTRKRKPDESPADCALQLALETLGFPLNVTRLNWPILRVAEPGQPDPRPNWFFAAVLSPLEWEVLLREGGPRKAHMIQIDVYLAAETALRDQQDSLRQYLSQSRNAPGA